MSKIYPDSTVAPIQVYDRRMYPIPELGEDVTYPSVTAVLDELIRKKGLEIWMANITAEYARDEILAKIQSGELTIEDVRAMDNKEFYKKAKAYNKEISEEAKDIGTRVHEFQHALFQRMIEHPGEVLTLNCDKDITEPCSALVEWVMENDVRPMHLEKRIWSQMFGGFGGRLDSVIFFGKLFITMETKTAKAVYHEYKLQTAAYDFGYEERNNGQYTDGMAILRLDKEKGFPEFQLYTKEERNDYLEEFGMWCEIWHKQDERRAREREALRIEKERLKELRKSLPKKKKLKVDPF
jgi:hypothetical protein